MHKWLEDCLELEKFHKEKLSFFGDYQNMGRSTRHSGWSISDTARVKNISKGKASEDLRLAQFYKKNKKLCEKMPERREALVYLKQFGINKIQVSEE